MLDAELEPDVLATRAQARQALADAIAAVDNARQRLAEARRAADLATDRAIELLHKIDAAKEQLDFMKAGRASAADSVIAALLRGDAMPAECSPAEKVQAQITDLEATRDQLRHARETAEHEIEERKSAVGLAEMRVKRMIGRVLQSSGAAETLMHGLLGLEREIIRRRLGLAFLLRNDGVPVALLAEVGKLLDGHALPTRAASSDHWGRNPAMKAWAAAMSTLERDADARLPLD